ncbi:MAG: aminodeoxychorismate/anthranilate synthase component II [Planctomycetota bacterium]
MILVIDNYDSFTYNLVQYLGELGAEPTVIRNDAITTAELEQLQPSHVVVSPGPGHPREAGLSNEAIRQFLHRVPILGVCLGHQCLAHVLGGSVVPAERLMHGKTSPIYHDAHGIYRGLGNPFKATRYHSLMVQEEDLPDVLEVSSQTADGEIMGIRLKGHPVEGVQFHPESILTDKGLALLKNFLES